MSDERPAVDGIALRFPSVSVFDQPDTHSRELKLLHQGDPFEVLTDQPASGPDGEFCQVRLADGTVGFVYAPNLAGPVRPPSPEERALTYQPAPLRTGRSATLPFLLNPMAVEEWRLWTPLTVEQCQGVLAAALRPGGVGSGRELAESGWNPSVLGQVTDQGFTLWKRHVYRSWYIATQAYGRFQPAPDGTRVVLRLSMDRLSNVLTLATLAAVAIWWLYSQLPVSLLTLGGLVAVGVFLMGRLLARDEGQYLLTFVAENLRTEERPLPTECTPQ